MPPAVIAAGVVAAGTIGGAVLSSHSQSKATDAASAAQQDSTAAQLQLGQQSLALQYQLAQQSMGLNQSIYNSNYDLLSPWVARGNVAGDTYSALLGLPSAPAMHSPLETSSGGNAPIPSPTGAAAPPTGAAPGAGSGMITGPQSGFPVTPGTQSPATPYSPATTGTINPLDAAKLETQYGGMSFQTPPQGYVVPSYTPGYGWNTAAPPSGYGSSYQTNNLSAGTPTEQAQQAIAMGADPAAVHARLAAIGGG